MCISVVLKQEEGVSHGDSKSLLGKVRQEKTQAGSISPPGGIHLAQQGTQGATQHDSKHGGHWPLTPDQNAGWEQVVNISLPPNCPLAWSPGPFKVVTVDCFPAWSRVSHIKRFPDPILKAPRASNDF